MRSAPAVRVSCSGGWGWRCLNAVLPLGLLSAMLTWGLGHGGVFGGPALWLGLAATLVAGLWRVLECRRPRPAAVQTLQWDGQHWRCAGQVASQVDVMMDLGGFLLLRLPRSEASGGAWVAVSAAEAGPAWHALRVAAYARASAAAVPAAAGSATT